MKYPYNFRRLQRVCLVECTVVQLLTGVVCVLGKRFKICNRQAGTGSEPHTVLPSIAASCSLLLPSPPSWLPSFPVSTSSEQFLRSTRC